MATAKGGSRPKAGRPKGALNKVTKELGEAAREYTGAALKCLVDTLDSDEAPHAAKIAAAKEILDRGHGKAKQDVQISGDEDNPLQSIIQVSFVGSPK